jgi:hypothetical protein
VLLLAPLELAHQPAQERVQLLLLLRAQRGGDQRFLLCLRADRVLPCASAGVGQLDEHAAPVVRVGDAPYEPGLLQPVEPVRHRAARELGPSGELARRLAVRRPVQLEMRKRLPLAHAQVEVGERLVEHPVEPALQAVDAVDDALDLEIDRARQLVLRQPAVDVVLLGFFHVLILDHEPLDVKRL